MGKGDVALGRHQGARQRGVHVPHDDHQVGPLGFEDLLEGDHHAGCLPGVGVAPHPQVEVRLGELELPEEDVAHPLVVVLTRVDDAGDEAPVPLES